MIHGKTMIQCVYDRAIQAKSLDTVIVATDSAEILSHFEGHGCITKEHETGTDRCAEVLSYVKEKFDYVINIQGDQPFIHPEQIDLLATLCDGETEIATLVKKLEYTQETYQSKNIVKVGIDKNMGAFAFHRGYTFTPWKHIGIYAYRVDILKQIASCRQTEREKRMSLEQYRWIDNCFKIKCLETTLDSPSIDTPEDLCELLKTLK